MLACDLHVHLDGSLREETFVELACREGLLPSPEAAAAFARDLRFRPGMDLAGCLARFGTTVGLLQTSESLRRVARELVADSYLDGVRHVEIRFCPALHTRSGLRPEEALGAVVAGCEDGLGDISEMVPGDRMSFGVVPVVLEGTASGEAEATVDLALERREAGVVGLDIAGDEALFDASRYRRAVERAREGGLGVTVHAGETGPPSNVRDALLVLEADRIGHGTSAARDPGVIDLLARRGATVEACLTSNVHTGSVARIEDHPLPRLLGCGVSVALATDNRFFSATTLSAEFDAAAGLLGLGADDLRSLAIESARAAFLNDEERLDLSRRVARSFDTGATHGVPESETESAA